MENQTEVKLFIILGMNSVLEHHYIAFGIFLLLYITTLIGNGIIVIIAAAEPSLHKPMYFFLGNLSCLDIFNSIVTVPKMLAGLLTKHQAISFYGCMFQLLFFYFLGSGECILLAVMAYDRYVAICNPLRYTIIMRKEICQLMAAATWCITFFHGIIQATLTAHLSFCGANEIEHYMCDIKPLLKLSCSNTHLNLIVLSIATICLAICPFIIIVISYLYIIIFLLFQVKSQSGRQKAFSTCGSHVTVVILFYLPVILNYIIPSIGTTFKRDMMLTLMYSAVTPALNPLIYTLRNQEVKMAMKNILKRKVFTFY